MKVGLDTEIRLRKEFEQLLASYKTPEQYDACAAEVGMSAEGQKIVNQLTTLAGHNAGLLLAERLAVAPRSVATQAAGAASRSITIPLEAP